MDKSLWKELIKSVKPLKKKVHISKTLPIKSIKEKKESDDMFEVSFLSADDIKKIKRDVSFSSELKIANGDRVDKTFLNNIKKGKFQIQARLDLHGMVLEKAFQSFVNFINNNFENNIRNLIVITGKGNPEYNTGIIRQEFFKWIKLDFANDKILYVNNALPKDGGDGAFYIFLRKK